MKRVATLTATIVILVAVLANAGWNDVPGELWAQIYLNDYRGTAEAFVIVSEWSYTMLRALLETTSDSDLQMMVDATNAVVENKWGPGSRAIYLRVAPTTGHEGDAYFWPTNIVLAQNHSAWDVDYDDCLIGFTDDFSGRVYGHMDGFILIPSGIDTTKEFTIWYDDERTTLGPLSK